jgi:hypothetical protein
VLPRPPSRSLRVLKTARDAYALNQKVLVESLPKAEHRRVVGAALRREAILTAAVYHSYPRRLAVTGAVLGYLPVAALAVWLTSEAVPLSKVSDRDLVIAAVLATIWLALLLRASAVPRPAVASTLEVGTLVFFIVTYVIPTTQVAATIALMTWGPVIIAYYFSGAALWRWCGHLAVRGANSRSGSLTSAQVAACLVVWQLHKLVLGRHGWDIPRQRLMLCRSVALTAKAVRQAVTRTAAARGGDPAVAGPRAAGLASVLYQVQERLASARRQSEYDRICADLATYSYLVAAEEWSAFEGAPVRPRRARWNLAGLVQPVALLAAGAVVFAYQGVAATQNAVTLLVAALLSFRIFSADTRATIVDTVRDAGKAS